MIEIGNSWLRFGYCGCDHNFDYFNRINCLVPWLCLFLGFSNNLSRYSTLEWLPLAFLPNDLIGAIYLFCFFLFFIAFVRRFDCTTSFITFNYNSFGLSSHATCLPLNAFNVLNRSKRISLYYLASVVLSVCNRFSVCLSILRHLEVEFQTLFAFTWNSLHDEPSVYTFFGCVVNHWHVFSSYSCTLFEFFPLISIVI